MKNELIWQDFITAFRPHTIRSCTRPMIVEWKSLLHHRGIYLDGNRERQQIEAVIDVLYRKNHIQANPEKHPMDEEDQGPGDKENEQDKGEKGRKRITNDDSRRENQNTQRCAVDQNTPT